MKKIIAAKMAPEAVGPYSQAVDCGDTVFLSGQIGINPESGKLEEGIAAQAHRVFKNLEEVLKASELSFEDVVKATVLLSDMQDFQTVNEIYKEYVPPPYPARICFQVPAMPLNALVEIDMIARRVEG